MGGQEKSLSTMCTHCPVVLFFLCLISLRVRLAGTNPVRAPQYLIPTYNTKGGASNQAIEFESAAVIARELNRTLCLPDFTTGPHKHLGPHRWHLGLKVSERFDLSLLARFIPIATSAECESACDQRVDAIWQLAPTSRVPYLKWGESVYDTSKPTVTLGGAHMRWSTPSDVRDALGALPAKCAAISGVFPGLRWHGSYMAVAPFLQPAPDLATAADQLRRMAFRKTKRYLAGFHWRFDESRCNRQRMGLCFLRCSDGAENSEPAFLPGNRTMKDNPECGRGFWMGVGLSVGAIVGAIIDRMKQLELKAVYIATDGALRGGGGCELIKEVVTLIRSQKVRVAGLWSCTDIPQANGRGAPSTLDLRLLFDRPPQDANEEPSNTAISLVEQVMCERATAFLGSPHSTWSLKVWRSREAARLVEQKWGGMGGEGGGGENSTGLGGDWEAFLRDPSKDSALIDSLLNDTRMAGGECVSSHWGRMYPVKPEPSLEQTGGHGVDTWLDYAACEAGGNASACQIPLCL